MEVNEPAWSSIAAEKVAEFSLGLTGPNFWKMNLVAVCEEENLLFVAFGDAIRTFDLHPDFTAGEFQDLRVPRSAVTNEGPDINFIAVGVWCGEKIIVALTMDSQAAIFMLKSLKQPPIILSNYSEGFEDNSTWSVAFHGSTMALGSNSYSISIWSGPNFVTRLSKHQHNVPCLDFSPSGRYLASTSIDSSVIIWENGEQVTSFRPSREWGWGVKWLPKSVFLNTLSDAVLHCSSETESLQDLILAHTSQSEFRLVSFTEAKKRRIEFSMQFNVNPFGHWRLSLMEAIPAMSMLVLGEWGGTRVYVLRLVRNEVGFCAEMLFTYDIPQFLLGLCVNPFPAHPECATSRLYLLLLNSTIQVLELTHRGKLTLTAAFV